MDINPVHQPGELPFSYGHNLFFRGRPSEKMLLQFFMPQAEPVSVPVQNFKHISFSVAKSKQMAGEGIKFQLRADQYG